MKKVVSTYRRGWRGSVVSTSPNWLRRRIGPEQSVRQKLADTSSKLADALESVALAVAEKEKAFSAAAVANEQSSELSASC